MYSARRLQNGNSFGCLCQSREPLFWSCLISECCKRCLYFKSSSLKLTVFYFSIKLSLQYSRQRASMCVYVYISNSNFIVAVMHVIHCHPWCNFKLGGNTFWSILPFTLPYSVGINCLNNCLAFDDRNPPTVAANQLWNRTEKVAIGVATFSHVCELRWNSISSCVWCLEYDTRFQSN